jgi:RNA polymerase sigma-70 factor (ECF subfamily)
MICGVPSDGFFPTTHWTLIGRLKSGDEATARRALEDLCAQYHYPLYCYIRRRGLDHHDAQDALHDFLVKLLRLETFAEADATKGHLRSFLATALQRFLMNWHRDHAGQAREFSVDALPPGADPEERYRHERFRETDTPERVFDRKWGHELMQRVLFQLGESYAARSKAKLFETLRPVLLAGGSLRGQDSARLAAEVAMSEGALRVALTRMLQDYRAKLEEEVLQTVESRDAVEAEIALLLQVFRR